MKRTRKENLEKENNKYLKKKSLYLENNQQKSFQESIMSVEKIV